MKSQNERIKAYLMTGRRLSSRKAMLSWNIYRLASRVHNLRSQGVPIMTAREPHRHGFHAVYFLPKYYIEENG